MAFDTMRVEKITINKIPDAVKQKFRAWTICSGDSCTYGLMYAKKQGYYILSSDCVLNGIQICYDSMADMKYCLVATYRVIEISTPVMNTVLKLHPSTKTIVWGDEGMDWINGYEFMKSGHYEVSFDITEDSSWTVEFDSIGNKCRSVLELTDKDDSQLPVGIHQYMTRHYKSDYTYLCQMDTSQPDKRYLDELDVYMDANDSVLYYGFGWNIKRWLIIDKECILLFDKQGKFAGKHNIHTPHGITF